MTDNQEAVLAEALHRRYCFTTDGPRPEGAHIEEAQGILAAMPEHTLVRKDEVERLRAALEECWLALLNLYELSGAARPNAKATIDRYRSLVNRAALAVTEDKR